VCKELLSTIKTKLMSVEKYGEARNAVEDVGLTNADEVLRYLSFTVKWKGLDPSAATIALR
jgi:hypothetical protein